MYTPLIFYPFSNEVNYQLTFMPYELVKPIVDFKLTQMGISFSEPTDSAGWSCSTYNYIMQQNVVAVQFQLMIYVLNHEVVLVPQYREGDLDAFNRISCLILEEFRPDWQHNQIIYLLN